MKPSFGKITSFASLALCALLFLAAAARAEQMKALIIDGQNNHNWKATTPILKAALESSGLFTVDVITTHKEGESIKDFKPDFEQYKVIVSNFNGADWPDDTQRAFEAYLKNGGGFVSVHAADNAMYAWKEYQKIIGIGGWNGRGQDSGSMLRWRDGKIVREVNGTAGGRHGANFSWPIDNRDPEHPIMKGLPMKWMHTSDELYATLVGPAENVTVLATAKSDVTAENEPILLTIQYGKGRVFHTTMGHDVTSMKDVGFVTTLNRGAEWAATGKVTQKVPADFPTADKTSVWNPPAK